jgi:hypothetical protein
VAYAVAGEETLTDEPRKHVQMHVEHLLECGRTVRKEHIDPLTTQPGPTQSTRHAVRRSPWLRWGPLGSRCSRPLRQLRATRPSSNGLPLATGLDPIPLT